jgi:hypothetical protein
MAGFVRRSGRDSNPRDLRLAQEDTVSGGRQEHEYRCIGGPLDGQTIRTTANKLLFSGEPGMAYHLTRPTDTSWREQYDELWDIRVPERL